MLLLSLASLVAVGFAKPPVWYPGGKCGVSKYPDAGDMELPPGNIAGGIEARPYEFPWQVSVKSKLSGSHDCGGTIINDRWVVCAAHCMNGGVSPDEISLVVGEHDRSAASTVRQIHDVDSIFVNEDYDRETNENDISLIKTSVPITFDMNVMPICAPDPENDYVYRKSQCSGWGLTKSGETCCPAVLRYVTLNVTTNAFCADLYNPTVFKITDDMVCTTDNTGQKHRDACQYDSGGPLSVKDGSGIFSLIGVVSFGKGCASGYPGVFSRVGFNAAWITDIISNN